MKTITKEFDESLIGQLNDFIDLFENKPNNIITILYYAQGIFGYLPPELQVHIARKTNMSSAKINGIVTFYSFFKEKKMGKFSVDVCMGTACFVKDSEAVLNKFKEILETDEEGLSKDGLFNINSIRCLGACGIGPVVRVNDKIFGHVKVEDVEKIIAEYRGEKNE